MSGSFPALFLILALVVGAYGFWQIQFLRKEGVFLKFHPVGSETFDKLDRQAGPSLEDLGFFSPKLTEAGIDKVSGNKEKIVFVLEWVMNQVKDARLDSFDSAIEAFESAQKGGGLSCESMSRIFVAAVRSAGFKARTVQLARSMLNDADTHVTAEVLIDGRWVIFDPIFNVSYRKGAELIGAEEVRQSLLDGTQESIKPVFYGEVNYPPRLATYYLSWLTLYNNVFFLEQPGGTKIPPFRYWWGPQWDYLESRSTGLWHFQSANSIYFLHSVVMPVTCLLFVGLSAVTYAIERKTPVLRAARLERNRFTERQLARTGTENSRTFKGRSSYL